MFGLCAAVFGGLGTGLSDWSLHNRTNERATQTKLINVLEIVGSVCGLVFTYPPYLGDDEWQDHPLVEGAWATAVIKAAFDAVGTGLGFAIPILKRSSLLKNAGGALEHVHKMLEGSAPQLLFGCVIMGLGVEGIKKYPPKNSQLKDLAIASSVLTSVLDILQVARAVVTHVVPNTPTSDWTIKLVAAFDGLFIASGYAFSGCRPPWCTTTANRRSAETPALPQSGRSTTGHRPWAAPSAPERSALPGCSSSKACLPGS